MDKVYIVTCLSMIHRNEQSSYIVGVYRNKEDAIEYCIENAKPNPEQSTIPDCFDYGRKNSWEFTRLSVEEWQLK